ncbi:MAG TPA: hypothetical protein DEP66_07510 [Acidimicrobiaceae bacterium]|nr:hypothetical protein [Acidimicrobiaceae bacterium]
MSRDPGRNSSAAAVRGLLLVLVTAAIGILLLRSGGDETVVADDAETDTAQPGDTLPATTTTAAPSTPIVTDADTATTTAAPTTTAASADSDLEGFKPRDPSEVTVQVANSTTVGGAAGRVTDRLKTLGFVTQSPTNLNGVALETTVVHYVPGSLLEAQNIASVLELDAQDDVMRMFEDTSAVKNYEMPQVFVALGLDLAN